MLKIGNDLVYIPRIKKLYNKHGIPERIYSKNEILYLKNLNNESKLIENMASRFCLKEAVSKAFGTGIAKGIRYVDIEIFYDENFKPLVRFFGQAKHFFDNNFIEIDISVSHDGEYVFGTCILN